jgi:transglutaminase-like putative cysteine protease
MRYKVIHRTEYEYRSSVSVSQHMLHLRPRATERQRVDDFQLAVEPPIGTSNVHEDFYGNLVDIFSIDTPHKTLVVTSTSHLEVTPPSLPDPESTPTWERARDAAKTELSDSHPIEFLYDSVKIAQSATFRDYALKSFTPERPLVSALLDLVNRMYREFRFDPKATNTTTPIEEAFAKKRGVCQDFAHIGIACLRSLGLPARYVSGYLETVPPPGKVRLAGADASHAWLAVWCPELGWIDADPTNNLLPGDRHVTIGWGRDFGDVSPIRGVAVGGGDHELKVGVDVLREGG